MKPSIHLIEMGVLLVAMALALNAWNVSRNDAAKLKLTLAEEQSVITQAANQVNDRNKILASAVAEIDAEKRRIRTPQQAAKAFPALLPELPQPLSIPQADNSAATTSNEMTPDSVNIPPDDIKPLYDHLQDCRICALNLNTEKQNLADETARNEALTKERDAAVAAARGGSKWIRLKHAAKWFSIGVIVGVSSASALATKH